MFLSQRAASVRVSKEQLNDTTKLAAVGLIVCCFLF
jgi:hypothetical protein